jgi:hypothetical protein
MLEHLDALDRKILAELKRDAKQRLAVLDTGRRVVGRRRDAEPYVDALQER